VKHTREGLTLWYATPDAPAPLGEVRSPVGTSMVAGVHPANPTNAVLVRYRVDGGHVRTVPGKELRVDHERQVQYFLVEFPPLPAGSVVEYAPVFSSSGRQVPGPAALDRFPAKFSVSAQPSPVAAQTGKRAPALCQPSRPDLDFIATVSVDFDDPLYVGETPEGIRIDYCARDGRVVGPRLNGKIAPGSGDHLFVRPDGIGVIRVRAVLITDDGAMLEAEYTGNLELGEDGYARALANDLPEAPPFVICPRILTGHAKYRWLNRVQCLGIGLASLKENRIRYDLFAVRAPATPGA
jgi:hypothetical protein